MLIGALCSVHGNEPYPIDLYASLEADPIPGVVPILGNPRAVDLGERYIDVELAFSAQPNPDSPLYERRRSAELRGMFSEFDLILSFHNARFPGPNTAYVNPTVDPRMTRVMAKLGIRHAVYENDELDRGIPHMMSVELPLTYDVGTPEYLRYQKQMDKVWRGHLARLASIASLDDLPRAKARTTTNPLPDEPAAIQFYEDAGAIRQPQARELGLARFVIKESFKKLPTEAAKLLGINEPLYIANWNEGNYDPGEFFGGLVRARDPYAADIPDLS